MFMGYKPICWGIMRLSMQNYFKKSFLKIALYIKSLVFNREPLDTALLSLNEQEAFKRPHRSSPELYSKVSFWSAATICFLADLAAKKMF